MENLEQRVKRIVAQQLGVDTTNVDSESSLVKDLGADSLDIMEVVMALEDELDYTISDKEVEKMRTVKQVIDNVKAHLG